jgi:hypothetical protein
MAQEFSVSIDLTQLTQLNSLTAVFPNLARSIETIAQEGVVRWQEAVSKVPGLWSGERERYKATIAARQVGPYAWEVYSDYKFVEDIESGRPPYDLKKMLDTSMKVRVSKAGRRYLIIPMRQNTPGNTAHAPAMSDEVYAEAKQLSHSRITSTGTRLSGTGAFSPKTRQKIRVATRKYAWGGSLPAGLVPKLADHHKTDPAAGMVRMKEKTGGSTYLTFRIMIEGSPGWIIPAKPGLWIAKNVAESLQRTAQTDMSTAIGQDLAAA